VTRAHGRLDVLVANAGILGEQQPPEATDEANWRNIFATNVVGGRPSWAGGGWVGSLGGWRVGRRRGPGHGSGGARTSKGRSRAATCRLA
jgi:NAD(P)-dependent dehydrogenase (short-subunit alcohol dehydrogenase family)